VNWRNIAWGAHSLCKFLGLLPFERGVGASALSIQRVS
jgi:hypothetical protein